MPTIGFHRSNPSAVDRDVRSVADVLEAETLATVAAVVVARAGRARAPRIRVTPALTQGTMDAVGASARVSTRSGTGRGVGGSLQ